MTIISTVTLADVRAHLTARRAQGRPPRAATTLRAVVALQREAIDAMLADGKNFDAIAAALGEQGIRISGKTLRAYHNEHGYIAERGSKSDNRSAVDAPPRRGAGRAGGTAAAAPRSMQGFIAGARAEIDGLLFDQWNFAEIADALAECGLTISPKTLRAYHNKHGYLAERRAAAG